MSEGLDARLIASFCVAIALDVLLPVAGVLWARRRLGVDWKVVGWARWHSPCRSCSPACPRRR